MNPSVSTQESRVIVYDRDALPPPGPALFDVDAWRAEGALDGAAPGRGTAFFIDAPFGRVVLRRYFRGGWAAKLSRDRYVYLGLKASRPFREFELLRRMNADGLRVPEPLAAQVRRHGLLYSGALMTRRIPRSRAWPDRFADPDLDWRRVGAGLREFHDAGVDHADMNARNILFRDGESAPWLIDFDRCSYRPGHAVDGGRNLARLRRSLDKLWVGDEARLDRLWSALLSGYSS
ncbi:3-deoxy-D-manno-octulosonic acid kinase [Marinihelvus fidelis]|nr:3-deoxy-D-manno-octulosonic acid kinase [Marinihelvus fidelis]